MTRENFKTKEYFNEYIKIRMDDVKESVELLSDKEVLPERLYLIKERIFEEKLHILIAKYSRGDVISDLAVEFNDVLKSWFEVCNLEWLEFYYAENLWFVSLGILLDMKEDVLEKIKKKLEVENIHDWLLNFLFLKADIQLDQIEGELLFAKEYQSIKDAICNNDQTKFTCYLKKEWYSNLSDCGWYDSHKLNRHNQNIYFGYWCFEAGAIVKRLNWDDTALKGQQYYPYDLVHY